MGGPSLGGPISDAGGIEFKITSPSPSWIKLISAWSAKTHFSYVPLQRYTIKVNLSAAGTEGAASTVFESGMGVTVTRTGAEKVGARLGILGVGVLGIKFA